MLLVRCGVDPELYFQAEDFRYIGGFNTLQTLNALGTAVSDISAMCLSEIARTALRRQHERENHTFAESSEKKYSVVRNQKNEPERGEEHESHHLHEAGGLSSSEPDSADISAGAWEIRKNAPQVPDGTPEVTYTNLLTSGQLYRHLTEIEQTARSRMEQTVCQMAQDQGVTEDLKAADPMKWVGLMNNIRASAEEQIFQELIYA